jgi:hypothetical protein
MATKKTLPVTHQTGPTGRHQSTAYGRLHALLNTVRCIAQYEDILCEITHETKGSGELSALLMRELDEILDKIPSHAYMSDLYAVRAILVGASPSASPKSKKPAKAKPSVGRANAQKSRKLAN